MLKITDQEIIAFALRYLASNFELEVAASLLYPEVVEPDITNAQMTTLSNRIERLVEIYSLEIDNPVTQRLHLGQHIGHDLRIVTVDGTPHLECLTCDLFLLDETMIKSENDNEGEDA